MLAYVEHMKRAALEEWRWARLEWACLKPVKGDGKLTKPPAMPAILRRVFTDGDT